MLRLADSLLQKGVPSQPLRESGVGGSAGREEPSGCPGAGALLYSLVAPGALAPRKEAGGAPRKRNGAGKIRVRTAEG